MLEVVLTILGGIGCLAMMGAAMWLWPRLGRDRRVRRLVARLRRQTTIDRMLSWAAIRSTTPRS